MYKVVSLFSGAGGMDLGFIQAGFEIYLANDYDTNAVETYRYNIGNHIIKDDIKNLFLEKNLEKYQDIDVIIGGPPCQGFSIAGNIGRTFKDDERNRLYKEFIRIVELIKPKFIVMENVARLYTHNKGKTREEIIKDFFEVGYQVEVKILNSADYGTPQIRNRVFFIGKRKDIDADIIFPNPSYDEKNYKTIKEAIDHFPVLNSGESCCTIPNHESMKHGKDMLEKMKYVKDGGGRENIPEEFGIIKGDVRKYIRYDSTKPSICVTGDMRKVFHYSQNRALTVRELATLQDFPENFKFLGTKSSQQQQVGNAVPVKLALAVAKCIKNMLNKTNKNYYLNIKKTFPKINYIGNKEKLVEWIIENIPKNVETVIDGFAGGNSVAYALKQRNFNVITNDILKINFMIAKALIENKKIVLSNEEAKKIFEGIPFEGFITKNYKNIYFFEDECKELDLYRKNIEEIKCEYKRALAFILLRRAMIRKMPYSRFNIKWDKIVQLRDEEYSYKKYGRKRAYHNQSFKEHFYENLHEYNDAIFDNGKDCIAYNKDIDELLEMELEADLIYLDPPYAGTLNDYFGFYGFLDSYIDGTIKKAFKNDFRHKNNILEQFDNLIKKASKYKYCMLSYNDKAYPTKEELCNILKKYYKNIKVIEKKHNYQITGKENKNSSHELLFICSNENILEIRGNDKWVQKELFQSKIMKTIGN